MASDKKLLAKVHKIFASEVERFYTDRRTKNRSGSIAFLQRFGSALNGSWSKLLSRVFEMDISGTKKILVVFPICFSIVRDGDN